MIEVDAKGFEVHNMPIYGKSIVEQVHEVALWLNWNELFFRMFPIASQTFRNEYDGD